MKKILTGLIGALMVLLMASGMAMAYSITFEDNVYNWPGWEVSPYERIGSPIVEDMMVTVTNGYLDKVEIQVTNRVWGNAEGVYFADTLFINVNDSRVEGYSYDQWDYYVVDTTVGAGGESIYSVADEYTYLLANTGGSRIGHPAGIEASALTDASGLLASVEWIDTDFDGINDLLVYDFNYDGATEYGIFVDYSFVIGFSQYCANDVHLGQYAPVPEPMTMLLLGFGLLGLGLARRKS